MIAVQFSNCYRILFSRGCLKSIKVHDFGLKIEEELKDDLRCPAHKFLVKNFEFKFGDEAKRITMLQTPGLPSVRLCVLVMISRSKVQIIKNVGLYSSLKN